MAAYLGSAYTTGLGCTVQRRADRAGICLRYEEQIEMLKIPYMLNTMVTGITKDKRLRL